MTLSGETLKTARITDTDTKGARRHASGDDERARLRPRCRRSLKECRRRGEDADQQTAHKTLTGRLSEDENERAQFEATFRAVELLL